MKVLYIIPYQLRKNTCIISIISDTTLVFPMETWKGTCGQVTSPLRKDEELLLPFSVPWAKKDGREQATVGEMRRP